MLLSRALALGVGIAGLLCSGEVQAQQKFALQLFHFNVQYVCGGTLGYYPTPQPDLELDNDTIEDRIITESLAPVVELFEKHPTWGVDLEMQGYMLDVIVERHPALADTMRTLAKSGQIDIVSFHYSDQLFVAYPQEDWERSQNLTAATFDKHDIPLSRTVFCQEGQAGSAMAGHMAQRGYRNMVWPKNLWIYQHGDFQAEPLYQFGDEAFLVAGSKGVDYDDGDTTVQVNWTFLDDGELLATGDLNPYFPELFYVDEEAVAAYEDGLSALEEQGYLITTVDKYVEAVKDTVPLATPPTLLDGTWQPDSTDGVKRWLGGHGVFRAHERDNNVRTLGMVAHRELVAAETIANEAGLDATDELNAAWRMLFLGQVTDATGINPFRGEIEYGMSHLGEATRIAREVIVRSKEVLGLQSVLIGNDVTANGAAPFAGEASAAALSLTIEGFDRAVSEQWRRVSDEHHVVTVDFGPGDFANTHVIFPGDLEDELTLTLALADATPVSLKRSDFSFEHFQFALPSGLIGLGNARYVIKDMATVHVAAEVARDSGDVRFADDTVPVGEAQRWVFHVVDGSPQEAVELALRVNARRGLVR